LAPNSATFNVWQHVVAVCDTVSVRIYVNGILKSTSASNCPTSSATDLHIGDSPNRAQRQFNGLIDDVRIYNRALSPDEIKRLYAMGGSKLQASRKGGSSLDQGLVGYWSFDGGDMAKNTAYDRSGQGNNGTLTNGPVRIDGKFGQALSFDGVNDFVSTGFSNMPANNSSQVVALWFKQNTRNINSYIFTLENSGASSAIRIGFDATPGDMYVDRWGGTKIIDSGTVPSLNTWHQYVYSYDGTTHRIYLDGAQIDSSTGVANTGTPNSVSIGKSAVSGRPFTGLIDDVRIYNRTLSPDEIKRLYSMGH
jgi:hypothetical protein